MQYITDWYFTEDLAIDNAENAIALYAKAGFSVKEITQEKREEKSRLIIEFERGNQNACKN